MEDLFITKLYSSGVLRYAENNSDMDMGMKFKYSAKGPNAVGGVDQRRISIRQRTLHPSMLGYVDCAESSASDPGRSGSLSPYCDMKSMYFDNSLYENEEHYRIAKYLDGDLAPDDMEELVIDADCEESYNEVLDKLCVAQENLLVMSGEPINPMEIVVEDDPRNNYRKFDESFLMDNKDTNEGSNK